VLEAVDRVLDEPPALRLAIAAHVSGLATTNNQRHASAVNIIMIKMTILMMQWLLGS